MRTPHLLPLAVFVASVALAEPPSAEEMAKLQHQVQKATDEVDKKYTGKQLSAEDRRQQQKERAAAESAVLEKAGVDKKEYARSSAKMSREDRAALEAEKEKLEKKDKASATPAEKGSGKEVVVEKGGAGQPRSDADEAAAMDRAMGYGKGGGGKRGKK